MRAGLCALLLGGFVASGASAEPVLLRSGANEGQGWAFALNNACWVATAGHVILDGAGVLVVGPDGAQGQGVDIRRDSALDLAFVRIVGRLSESCPSSTLGDRDSRPLLSRILKEGRTIAIERRVGSTRDGAYGVDILPIEVVALSEAESAFTIRVIRGADDAIVQSDSGSPVRMRGAGVLEAGLPLGLVIADEGSIESGFAKVIRMDAVRAAAERLITGKPAGSPSPSNQRGQSIPYQLVSFTGVTPDTACGPVNLTQQDAGCGWRVQRGTAAPELVIRFDAPTKVTGVRVSFAMPYGARGVAVSTAESGQSPSAWVGERYCPIPPGAGSVLCTLGERTTASLRLVFDGSAMEIKVVDVR